MGLQARLTEVENKSGDMYAEVKALQTAHQER